MRYFILVFVMANVFAFGQNVNYIKKMNLFDPNRGYVEEKGEEVDTEKEIKLPSNMPVLDGIFIDGNYKRAIFTYYDKKKKKKISMYHSPGEKFADAVLNEITPEYVFLYFGGKKYKLYPDTKLKAKKSSGYSPAVARNVSSPTPRPSKKVVSRRTSSKKKKAARKPNIRKVKRNFYNNRTRRRPTNNKVRAVRRNTKRNTPKKRTPRKSVNTSGRSNPFVGGAKPRKPSPKPNTNRSGKTPF